MPDRRISRRLFLALAAPVMGAACETVPYTGRSQLQLISAEQETQMGAQTYTQTLAKEKLSTDPVAAEMVKRVGSRIAAVTGLNYQWEYRLIQNDKTVNAFALPGGKVAVYTGMLPVTRDEWAGRRPRSRDRPRRGRPRRRAREPAAARERRGGVDHVRALSRQSRDGPGGGLASGSGRSGRRAPAVEPSAGVRSRSSRAHLDGEGRVRSARRS